ncbi:MAG: hypothetical protein ACLUMK_14930 [Christensenellales bacterium]
MQRGARVALLLSVQNRRQGFRGVADALPFGALGANVCAQIGGQVFEHCACHGGVVAVRHNGVHAG